jgi:hypothetical protein
VAGLLLPVSDRPPPVSDLQALVSGLLLPVSDLPPPVSDLQDRGDGTYSMRWRTERAATYTTAVLLGGVHVEASPLTTRISPNVLHPGNTLVNGGCRAAGLNFLELMCNCTASIEDM